MNSDLVLVQIRHGMCCRKQKYVSMDTAAASAIRVNTAHPHHLVSAYYCPFCNYFHIGGKPKATTRRTIADIARMLRFDFSDKCSVCEYNSIGAARAVLDNSAAA